MLSRKIISVYKEGCFLLHKTTSIVSLDPEHSLGKKACFQAMTAKFKDRVTLALAKEM